MSQIRLPLLIILAVGACTPAGSVEAPSPVPARPPAVSAEASERAERSERAEPSEQPDSASASVSEGRVPAAPVAALATAPERWWLGGADAATPGAGVTPAYQSLLAGKAPKRTVVVGVIDSGVEIGHEDLDDNLWVNEGEVPGNGIDDDGNGYVDDIHGWNFIGGADGSHVDQDTYEVARLSASCRAAGDGPGEDGEGRDGAGPEPMNVSCAAVEAELEESRRETEEQLHQMRFMEAAFERVVGLLREEAGTDTLSVGIVAALTPLRMDVQQARMAYLQLAEAGASPGMIAEERRRLEDRLEYGLNPDFDPRDRVGDDYDDVGQRGYGNADVTGPRAGHGTGVAGIIAAERDNGIGEDGIAPSARIMVLRAVPDGDERDKDVANAIRYAVDNGAHIINMSFGKGHSPRKDAVDAAVRHAEERGVLLVHAAGNAGADLALEPSYPTRTYLDGGAAGNWIEVGASSWEGPDRLAASFSNYGRDAVDVFAPGVDIRTTDVGNGFQTSSGTSFAAPVVSGLAALIMAYYPELDAAAVRGIILDSARPAGSSRVVRPGAEPRGEGATVPFGELSITGGLVDAYAALQLAEQRAKKSRAETVR